MSNFFLSLPMILLDFCTKWWVGIIWNDSQFLIFYFLKCLDRFILSVDFLVVHSLLYFELCREVFCERIFLCKRVSHLISYHFWKAQPTTDSFLKSSAQVRQMDSFYGYSHYEYTSKYWNWVFLISILINFFYQIDTLLTFLGKPYC